MKKERQAYTILSNLKRNRIHGILDLVKWLLEIRRLLSPQPRQRQLGTLLFGVLALGLGGSHHGAGLVLFFAVGLALLLGLGFGLFALGDGDGAGVDIAGRDGRSLLLRGAIGEGTLGHGGFFGLGF